MKRNKFSLSNYKLLTLNYGDLVPVNWYEALPGDTLQMSTSMLVRSTPLVAPVMHPVRVRLHTYFVPNRLLWDDWEDFITGGPDGTFEAQPPTYQQSGQNIKGTLNDYLGIPVGDYTGNPIIYSMLPHRAYALIYNERYRDQDLVSELTISKASGIDSVTPQTLQRVAWQKDYYTTARPWSSKGNEILLPLSEDIIDVTSKGSAPTWQIGSDVGQNLKGKSGQEQAFFQNSLGSNNVALWDDPQLEVDLRTVSGISVNDFRNYLALQRYQEARANFGSRYSEYIKYLVPGIGNLDARLQEPEYIHGGSSTISFSEVLQTQRSDDGETPLGTMGGHGISAMRTRRARKFCPEHGIVMSLLSVVPKSIYSQQVERKWHRLNKEMYFQKELQYIGEQPITNREVYAFHSQPTETFGYNHRYDEYRQSASQIHGDFLDTQDGWHFARIFAGDIALNKSFIECNPALRPYADQTSDPLMVMVQNSVQARRVLSKWATPKTF